MLLIKVDRVDWEDGTFVRAQCRDSRGRYGSFVRAWPDSEFRRRFWMPFSLRAHLQREAWQEARDCFGPEHGNRIKRSDVFVAAGIAAIISIAIVASTLIGCGSGGQPMSPLVAERPVAEWSNAELDSWATSPMGLESNQMAQAFQRLANRRTPAGIVKAIIIAKKRSNKDGAERVHVAAARSYLESFRRDAVLIAISGNRGASNLSPEDLVRRYEALVAP